MKFLYYDLIFLVVFSIAVAIFLFKRRKNLKVESKVFVLYRTQVGIRFINYIGTRFPRFFKYMTYVVITCGYALMIAALYFFIEMIRIIIRMPAIVKIAKVPPIMPLVPYLPQMFNIEFLPPFYFTYWIISIAIIAICHEFAHGIFARYSKVRIKSTGFGFLGPFLAAFVEPDEKELAKKSNKAQIAVLSAGSFANLLVTFIFLAIMALFFSSFFAPAGISFGYVSTDINIRDITYIGNQWVNNLSLAGFSSFIDNFRPEKNAALSIMSGNNRINLTQIGANNKVYFVNIDDDLKNTIKSFGGSIEEDEEVNGKILVFEDTPALRVGLSGSISKINSAEIRSIDHLENELEKYKPGESVIVETINKDYGKKVSRITLASNPENESRAFLGIGLVPEEVGGRGIFYFIARQVSKFRKPNVYYMPLWQPNLIIFIYNLLWWIILINISVALVNMLPLGIFDGGRVFYLTVLAITKSKRNAQRAFRIVTLLILLLFIFLTLLWFLYR